MLIQNEMPGTVPFTSKLRMKSKTLTTLASAVLIAGLSLNTADAAIIVIAPTATEAGSLQITDDIHFTITTELSNDAFTFVFDEWVTSDGSFTTSAIAPDFAIKINNGSIYNYSSVTYNDNLTVNNGVGTPNDGYILVDSSLSLALDDVVTVLAGTYSIASAENSNQGATQTFTGTMFMTNSSAEQISDFVVVPEPKATTILFGIAALSVTYARRRKNIRPARARHGLCDQA